MGFRGLPFTLRVRGGLSFVIAMLLSVATYMALIAAGRKLERYVSRTRIHTVLHGFLRVLVARHFVDEVAQAASASRVPQTHTVVCRSLSTLCSPLLPCIM